LCGVGGFGRAYIFSLSGFGVEDEFGVVVWLIFLGGDDVGCY